MLDQFGPSTIVAVLVGGMLAIVAFVPVAVLRYRRAGRLRPLDLLVLLAIALYATALWSYTLVPLPETDSFKCVPANLRPLGFLDDIRKAGGLSLGNRALLQAAFNIVLFLPLGFFLRVLWRRGVLIGTLVGFLVSLTIEFTQRTGLWGLFHCAYRVFDVDDLIMNTTGALLGSLFALPVTAILDRRRPAPAVTTITVGRRFTGFLVDLIGINILGTSLVITWRMVALFALEIPFAELPEWVDLVLGLGVPALIEAWWVLARGQTAGEQAVQLVAVARTKHVMRSRLLKYCFGVGGFMGLAMLPVPFFSIAFDLTTIALAIWSTDHRGLSHLVAGMDLQIDSDAPPGPTPAEID